MRTSPAESLEAWLIEAFKGHLIGGSVGEPIEQSWISLTEELPEQSLNLHYDQNYPEVASRLQKMMSII